jgi:hypothetical protein
LGNSIAVPFGNWIIFGGDGDEGGQDASEAEGVRWFVRHAGLGVSGPRALRDASFPLVEYVLDMTNRFRVLLCPEYVRWAAAESVSETVIAVFSIAATRLAPATYITVTWRRSAVSCRATGEMLSLVSLPVGES